MALGEAREHLVRGLDPLLGHPRAVRHHAGPLVRRLAGLGRERAELGEAVLDLPDRHVLAGPVLRQCLRHDLPSRWIRSSALGGPQVPAG